jgi:hypothetical protein
MCAVRRVELLQDVADVHLDRVFLHFQPSGDHLIGLSLAQKIDYRKLTRREVVSVRSPLPDASAAPTCPASQTILPPLVTTACE